MYSYKIYRKNKEVFESDTNFNDIKKVVRSCKDQLFIFSYLESFTLKDLFAIFYIDGEPVYKLDALCNSTVKNMFLPDDEIFSDREKSPKNTHLNSEIIDMLIKKFNEGLF